MLAGATRPGSQSQMSGIKQQLTYCDCLSPSPVLQKKTYSLYNRHIVRAIKDHTISLFNKNTVRGQLRADSSNAIIQRISTNPGQFSQDIYVVNTKRQCPNELLRASWVYWDYPSPQLKHQEVVTSDSRHSS